MHRQADGAPGISDPTGYRLADPPSGICRKLEALTPIELLHGVHKAEVALLHQVEQRQLGGLVLLGDRHDEPQVGLDEGLRRLVALPDRTPQLPLFGNGQRLPEPISDRAARPASIACASLASSSFVSSECLPMSFR